MNGAHPCPNKFTFTFFMQTLHRFLPSFFLLHYLIPLFSPHSFTVFYQPLSLSLLFLFFSFSLLTISSIFLCLACSSSFSCTNSQMTERVPFVSFQRKYFTQRPLFFLCPGLTILYVHFRSFPCMYPLSCSCSQH